MRKLFAVVVVALVLVIGIIGCDQTATPAPQPYVPKYTTDQVIAVAQAQYPVGIKRDYVSGQTITLPPSISAQYIGGNRAAWKVTISLPLGFRYGDYTYGTKTLYFYETDGSLRKTYDP